MYYEEKIIDGVLHFRTMPREEWRPCTLVQLTDMLIRERNKDEQ